MSPFFAITVEFELAPGNRDRFLELVRENAASSVWVESGCQRFDVLLPARENAVLLYEVYDDAAAFDAHVASDHFKAFDRATKDMVVSKKVDRFQAITHEKEAT